MIALNEERFYEEIGERIRKKRIEAGINQEVFSQFKSLALIISIWYHWI